MLASSARVVPANLVSAEPSAQLTLPLSIATWTPAIAAIFNVPFGPLPVIVSLATVHSTPLGSVMGFFATRDIFISLRHGADDFAADALGARLGVAHDAVRRGNDGDAESAHDLGQLVLAAIHAQTRTADAVEFVDRRPALEILQRDLEHGLGAVLADLEVAHVAFVLEYLDDGDLDVGSRHAHRRPGRGLGVADTRKHVGDGISHAHCFISSASISVWIRWVKAKNPLGIFRKSKKLPAGLAQARHVAAHGRFAQLVAAEGKLAVDAARTAGQLAAVALARGTGVARQLLQLGLRGHLLLIRGFRAEHDGL